MLTVVNDNHPTVTVTGNNNPSISNVNGSQPALSNNSSSSSSNTSTNSTTNSTSNSTTKNSANSSANNLLSENELSQRQEGNKVTVHQHAQQKGGSGHHSFGHESHRRHHHGELAETGSEQMPLAFAAMSLVLLGASMVGLRRFMRG
ncbi:hypothetical protein [Kitasatospora sp. GP82]|uniref:hypothetical protein n=1 Tax=Kitasatospora sp. GP82 TaxID=3035089 RepID=UPI002475B7E1|nr:hypothetical protein [Kitasatospora sp. GP82]MDH6125701.1 LPXTG-motif cell wall-anchored protein [Kitasatospora sp. GP82]